MKTQIDGAPFARLQVTLAPCEAIVAESSEAGR